MSDDNELGRVVTRKHGMVTEILIDRPAKMNGFTPKMFRELAEAYTEYERDERARCAILCASGPHFTAGLDLPRMESMLALGRPLAPDGMIDPLMTRAPFRTKPVVAAVQGVCFTVGIELMLAADFVVAADDCRFAQLEVQRGLMAAGGATMRFLERGGWGNAMRYLLTGDEFDAGAAQRFGFVQEVVPAGTQRNWALLLAQRIADRAPLAVRATLANVRKAAWEGTGAAADDFGREQARLLATDDAREGIESFREKRPASFRGR